MAKRKRRKGGGSFGGVVRRVKRRSGRGFSGGGDGFSIGKGLLTGVTVGVAGIGVNWITEKLTTPGSDGKSVLPSEFAGGTNRALVKAGLGIGLGMLAKKFGMGKYAMSIASGGVALATLDLYAQNRARAGLAGVDFWNTGRGLQGYPQLTDGGYAPGMEYANEYAVA